MTLVVSKSSVEIRRRLPTEDGGDFRNGFLEAEQRQETQAGLWCFINVVIRCGCSWQRGAGLHCLAVPWSQAAGQISASFRNSLAFSMEQCEPFPGGGDTFQLVSGGPWKSWWKSLNGPFRLHDKDSFFWFMLFDWPCLLSKHFVSLFPQLVFSPS